DPAATVEGGDPVLWLTVRLETGYPRWPSLPKMGVKQKRPPVRGYPKSTLRNDGPQPQRTKSTNREPQHNA
ncbi:hypothetical protein AVEN_17939-1, partial [Araneus ventricosus]